MQNEARLLFSGRGIFFPIYCSTVLWFDTMPAFTGTKSYLLKYQLLFGSGYLEICSCCYSDLSINLFSCLLSISLVAVVLNCRLK